MLCWLNRFDALFIKEIHFFLKFLLLSIFQMIAFLMLQSIQSALMHGEVICKLEILLIRGNMEGQKQTIDRCVETPVTA